MAGMADEPQQRYSELASFGEELRREREIRGISLKEISDATKISKRFLEAIEKNDHRTLPAPVFTRGFVREYARYLGLNSEEIVNRYNFAAAGDDRIEQSTHLDRLVQPQALPLAKDREKERERERGAKSIPPPYARIDRNVYILVVIVAALLAASWWALKHKRETRTDEARVDTAAVIAPKTAPSPTPTPIPEPPPIDDSLKLTIDVTRDSWVTLEVDGKKVLDEELRAGDHRVVEGKETFRFVGVGNPRGLTLKLNNFDLPRLEKGRATVFDRGTLQELQSEKHNQT
jgi:cytoskeletal protein RodZ